MAFEWLDCDCKTERNCWGSKNSFILISWTLIPKQCQLMSLLNGAEHVLSHRPSPLNPQLPSNENLAFINTSLRVFFISYLHNRQNYWASSCKIQVYIDRILDLQRWSYRYIVPLPVPLRDHFWPRTRLHLLLRSGRSYRLRINTNQIRANDCVTWSWYTMTRNQSSVTSAGDTINRNRSVTFTNHEIMKFPPKIRIHEHTVQLVLHSARKQETLSATLQKKY